MKRTQSNTRSRFGWLSLPLAMVLACLTRVGLPQAHAAGADDVWTLLSEQASASGVFEQELYDEEGELLESSRGTYAVMRPGYFRWEIEAPDRQLIVVADGVLWHYDRDLESATRRSTEGDEVFSPLELLAGDNSDLRGRFDVEALAPEHFRLIPTFPGAAFGAVELIWNAGAIVAMDISDRSGQQIVLALTPEEPPRALSRSDFAFEVPEGVEVYDAASP